MAKKTLHLNHLSVDAQAFDGVVHGGLLVSGEGEGQSWRLHAATTQAAGWEPGEQHELRIVTMDGATLTGTAVLDRSDGKAHYFVGVGGLAGLNPD